MIKVLITGFRHSGTTMLHQLIKAHPNVGWIENEESLIEFDKPREWVLKLAERNAGNLNKNAWGEKIPWGTRDTDIGAKRAIAMSNKWLKYFRKEARVLNILRHPLDAILSGGSDKIDKKVFKHIMDGLPKYINAMNPSGRFATIVYEDLVTHPATHLPNIFQFLNLPSDKKIINRIINTELKFGKINASRAFAYRTRNLGVEVDYEGIVGLLRNRL